MNPSDPNYSPPKSRTAPASKRKGPFGIPVRSEDPYAEEAARGSFAAGFVLGWLIMVAAFVAAWAMLVAHSDRYAGFVLPGMLGTMAASALGFAVKGRSRVARGILAAFGSLIALIVLLVAACFGLVLTHRGM